MKKALFYTLFGLQVLLSCKNHTPKKASSVEPINTEEITWLEGKNYFVRNTIKGNFVKLINDRAEFDSIFGMATVMGPKGKPSTIDFQSQSVVAIVEKETDSLLNISSISLNRQDSGILSLSYLVTNEGLAGFTSKPFFLLIFDKGISGSLMVKRNSKILVKNK